MLIDRIIERKLQTDKVSETVVNDDSYEALRTLKLNRAYTSTSKVGRSESPRRLSSPRRNQRASKAKDPT